MRRNVTAALLVAALATACASSSVGKYAQADRTFTGAVKFINDQREAGKISDEKMEAIAIPVRKADKYLDLWFEALKNTPVGEKPKVDINWIDEALDAVEEVLLWSLKYKESR